MSNSRRLSTSHHYNDGGGSVGKDKDLDIKCRQFFVAKLGQLMAATSSISSSAPLPDIDYTPGPSDIPTFEAFLDKVPASLEESKFFQDIRAGNTLFVEVRSIDSTGLIVKPLCVDRGPRRDLESLNLDIFVPMILLVAEFQSIYSRKQLLRAYVFAVSPENRTMNLRVEESDDFSCDQKLGPITEDAMPDYFRAGRDVKETDMDSCLRHSRSFRNPTAEDQLCAQLGLFNKFTCDSGHRYVSFLESINRTSFAPEEFATPMRKVQNNKLAMKSVVKGVERFRAGKNGEAMQHLNKALQVEAENVEALVARGALYANSESFVLAVQDLELALKIKDSHANGRKYLIETLMAQGRAFESTTEGKPRRNMRKAARCYERVLELDPKHEDARARWRRAHGEKCLSTSTSSSRSPVAEAPSHGRGRKRRRPSSSSSASDRSVIELSDEERPKSSKSLETPSTIDDDLRAQLVDYFVKHNPGTTVAEAGKKLADPALLERLKVYYEMYHKGSGDSAGRRLSEGDARKAAPDKPVADSDVVIVHSADRPAIERRPVRPQHQPQHQPHPSTLTRLARSILYERQIVPRIVPSILEEAGELDLQQLSLNDLDESIASPKLTDSQRFTKEFMKIRESLRDVFRSCNRNHVDELVLIIGPPYVPREIYRLPIKLDQCQSDGDGSCGENCGPLAMRELRKVSTAMFTQPPSANFEKLPKSAASRKVSVYVRAKQGARMPDSFEEDDSFGLPNAELAAKRKVGIATVRLQHGGICRLHDQCVPLNDDNETADDEAAPAWFSHSTCLLGFTD
uniref:Uncharacterized protein n=1 Tax=Plectus sambesii TaxID=2011161 RepID=A0A914V014_9BILA